MESLQKEKESLLAALSREKANVAQAAIDIDQVRAIEGSRCQQLLEKIRTLEDEGTAMRKAAEELKAQVVQAEKDRRTVERTLRSETAKLLKSDKELDALRSEKERNDKQHQEDRRRYVEKAREAEVGFATLRL